MDFPTDFFDNSKPCPPDVVNCEKLRAEYFSELEKIKQQGGCSSCIERSLRNKYITFILSSKI